MEGFPFFYSPFAPMLVGIFTLIFLAAVFVLVLKGYSLWYAARGGQTWWFIALLVVNTLGIFEIIYLVWFRPKDGVSAAHKSPAADSSSPAPQS